MSLLAQKLHRFLENEEGPTAVEYAVMLGLIITVCFVAIGAIGRETNKVYDNAQLKAALKTTAAGS